MQAATVVPVDLTLSRAGLGHIACATDLKGPVSECCVVTAAASLEGGGPMVAQPSLLLNSGTEQTLRSDMFFY